MKTSAAGLRLIETFEGLRLVAYPDPGTGAEPWTIGIGTTRYPNGTAVQPGDKITEAQARNFLAHDVQQAEAAVNGAVAHALTQAQFDALVSLVYNIGVGAFSKSTLVRKLNAGDAAGAAAEFDKWVNAGGKPMEGLRRRRRAERALFETDVAAAPIEARTAPPADPRPNDAFRGFDTAGRTAPAQPAASKPMGPFVLPALSILADLVPSIGKLFKGEQPSAVAERNAAAFQLVVEKLSPLLLEATGAPNLQGAVERVQADQAARSAVDEAVQKQYFELLDASEKSTAAARDFAVAYSQMQNVRTVVGRFTFLELLTLVLLAISAGLTGWLIYADLLKGELLGAVVTLVVVAGFVDVRKFWLGLPAPEQPKQGGQ